MHIDYLALMLVNFTAGLALLACWIYLDAGRPAEKRWIPGFAVCGLLALILGLNMVFNWPLPGVQNALYGGMSVLFGTLLLGLVLVVWFESDLLPLAVFAAIAGLASLIAGIQVI
ncbi:MAG: DUF981 domain-containing protein, partial [Deltaproteobacteria bacterium]|nr:DUF981 domain-containing protein [Deltaproteobacteria bacterium]